jgi:hypothetical protein
VQIVPAFSVPLPRKYAFQNIVDNQAPIGRDIKARAFSPLGAWKLSNESLLPAP